MATYPATRRIICEMLRAICWTIRPGSGTIGAASHGDQPSYQEKEQNRHELPDFTERTAQAHYGSLFSRARSMRRSTTGPKYSEAATYGEATEDMCAHSVPRRLITNYNTNCVEAKRTDFSREFLAGCTIVSVATGLRLVSIRGALIRAGTASVSESGKPEELASIPRGRFCQVRE